MAAPSHVQALAGSATLVAARMLKLKPGVLVKFIFAPPLCVQAGRDRTIGRLTPVTREPVAKALYDWQEETILATATLVNATGTNSQP